MKTRAAVHEAYGKPLVVGEVELPNPSPSQVLVKLLASGICHTQLSAIENPTTRTPALLGHEGTGVVLARGRDVDHVKEGDHVLVSWVSRHPQRGRPAQEPPVATYHGQPIFGNVFTWSEHVLTSERQVVPIPNDVPTDITSIIGCAVLTGAGAVLRTAKVQAGQSVAIFGMGGVGLSALQAAASVSAYPIVAVDLVDKKLELAVRMGATHTVNASRDDPVVRIHEITNGGAEFAFDAIGVLITAAQILLATRPGGSGADNVGGTSVLIGFLRGEASLDLRQLMLTQRIYRGTLGAARPTKDFPMYLRMWREGKMNLEEMVTDRFRLEQINEAVAALSRGEIMGRAIIEY